MPLTDYQERLARLLSENRTFDSYLAGGFAILIEPNTKRFSRNLGYFHDSEARVVEAFSADRRSLESSGYSVDVDLNQPGFVRAIVLKDGHATKVEWALDSVDPFVASRPPEEIDCLYHSASRRGFVDPREVTDAVPHFGRPGGVLPRIIDSWPAFLPASSNGRQGRASAPECSCLSGVRP